MTIITEQDAIKLIEELIKKHGNLIKAAAFLDVAPSVLSDIRHGRRPIPNAVAQKLGYKRVYSYQKEK
jgi:plasmid maintenance system antidote protein VapI